ncbi:uncharacterized protein LOC130673302 [Microplitis mediator]|uniref:uncharacterized protein LOC130673302 n=1 Tax=Microplitis mediator TaxID=375433 RepID=UPI0025544AC4|nr:uncharacterized protein LOC130673302 [Microplitis mediator]
MELKKTELISTFLIIFLTGALASEQEYVEGRFSYVCLKDSVVVKFSQYGVFKINMYADSAREDQNKDTECSRHFTLHESAVKEFNFESCAYGSRLFPLTIQEQDSGTVLTHAFTINCVGNSDYEN